MVIQPEVKFVQIYGFVFKCGSLERRLFEENYLPGASLLAVATRKKISMYRIYRQVKEP